MALIKTVTRISPMHMWTNEVFSKLSSPEQFGIPYKVEVCDVTNPITGMLYRMETTYILEDIDSANQDVNKVLKYGLVPAINNGLQANCDASNFFTLFIPKKIKKPTISSILDNKKKKYSKPKKTKTAASIKLRLNLKDLNTSKGNKITKKNYWYEKHLQSLLHYFVDNECLICGFISLYESESNDEHMKTHIRNNSLLCDCCNISFKSAADLFDHKITRTKKKPYLCEVCNQKFKRNYFLTLHLQSEHASSLHPIHSKQLSNSFPIKPKAQHKQSSKSQQDSFSKSKIQQSQKHSSSWNKIGEPRLPSKSKNNTQTLHYSPSGNNIQSQLPASKLSKKQSRLVCSIACTICSKKFQSIPSVLGHRRYHAGAERYKCLICYKRFSNSRILKYHEHVLSADKKSNPKIRKVLFSCNLCEDKFYFKNKLVEHKKLAHDNN